MTTTEAQAYVGGWHHCMTGNDIRWGNPHYKINDDLAYAWNAGALDAMEAQDGELPEPECAGFGRINSEN